MAVIPTTTMAAALSSGTLIVAAVDGIHVLALDDGSERWRGVPEQAVGRLREPILMGNRLYVLDTPEDKSPAAVLALEG